MLVLGSAVLLRDVLFHGTKVQFIFLDGTTLDQHCGLREDNVRLYFKARAALLDTERRRRESKKKRSG